MGRMILVTGGSGSGKSAYAEQRILEFGEKTRIYIATMIPWDEECRNRIEKHRLMRKEKQFETIEQYRDMGEILPSIPENAAVLLECMSNLTANELFAEDCGKDLGEAEADIRRRSAFIADKIKREIQALKDRTAALVIVTNEIFSDGVGYDEGTECYRRMLGQINCALAAMADEVVEVVFSIPIFIKSESTAAFKPFD